MPCSRHCEARSDPCLVAVIARHEAIHGLPRFARNDDKVGIALRPSLRGTKRSMDCRASLAMTPKTASPFARHREARSDPCLVPVIARHEAIRGLPRFARNDAKDGIPLRPSSRGTKRSMDCRASLAMTPKTASPFARHCEERSNPCLAPVIARHEAIHGLPRFARNDDKDGTALRPSSRGTKRSMNAVGVCQGRWSIIYGFAESAFR
jgi:hypothetical protein